MRCFGLNPDQVLTRAPAEELGSPTRAFAMLYGGLSFGVVSVLAYCIYAFRLIQNTGAMYATTAGVYIALTGLALSRVVIGRGVAGRFALLFATAFLAYAVLWCAFWFGMRGKHYADLWGAAAGLAVMAALIRSAFGGRSSLLPLWATLFACHSLGYYLGDVLHATVRGTTGKLLWGAAHGVGFGVGLGYVLHECQAPLKSRLASHLR